FLALPLAWPVTPIETVSERDLDSLVSLLEREVRGQAPTRGVSASGTHGNTMESTPHERLPVEEVLQRLSLSYGASGHEGLVREAVLKLLPSWAKPETDASGNLVLRFGSSGGANSAPPIVFVAHMDEIGYDVKAIAEDGRLEAAEVGGGSPQ